jgi:hypothetical protein
VAIGQQSSGDVILAGGMAVTDAHGNMQFGVARLHGDAGVGPAMRPLLSNVARLTGAVRFTINGEVGRSYVIETTGDFSGWVPMATQMQTSASQPFTDSSVTGVSRRLYRAKVAQ